MNNTINTVAARVLALVLAVAAGPLAADTLSTVRARGALVVGVLPDNPPYSYRDEQGLPQGLEADLAENVATLLGVSAQLVRIDVTERITALREGRVDLLIAGIRYNAELASVVQLITPGYYSAGINILARRSDAFTSWHDLAGVPVCAIDGARFNSRVTSDFGADLLAYKSAAEAYDALIEGLCRAFVYDGATLTTRLADPAWAEYEMPLPSEEEVPWVMAIQPDPLMTALLTGLTVQWLRTGFVLELQDKWGIRRTGYLISMHDIYQ